MIYLKISLIISCVVYLFIFKDKKEICEHFEQQFNYIYNPDFLFLVLLGLATIPIVNILFLFAIIYCIIYNFIRNNF